MKTKFLSAAAALCMAATCASAQTVNYRVIERTGQNTGSDTLLELAVQAQVTGGNLGGFSFDIVFTGEAEANGTLGRARISNADHTYFTGAPWAANSGVGTGGVASTFSYLAGINANFNGLINISGGTFTNNPAANEIGLVAGAATGSALLNTPDIDTDGDGIPDLAPSNGGVSTNNEVSPLEPTTAGPYFGNGQYIDIYRFRYTLVSTTDRTFTINIANPSAQTFSQLLYNNGAWGAQNSTLNPANISTTGLTITIGTGGGVTNGTCCSAAGACTFIPQASCTAPSVWTTGGTCTPNPCPGACCDTSCVCTVTAIGACTSPSTFVAGGVCTPSPCVGKCCASTNGACTVVVPASCVSPSVFTCGSTCAAACPGVCCSTTSCVCTATVITTGCAAGTTYQGAGSVCTPSPCGGKCCASTNGACTVVAPASCVSPSVFTCGGTCAAACPGVCCSTSNCTCTAAVITTGCAAGTTFQGATSTCTPSPCTGKCCSTTTGACTVVAPATCVAPSVFTCGSTCSAACPGVCCSTSSCACTAAAVTTGCAAGTTYQGVASTCAPSPCTGKCCNSLTGNCSVTDPASCVSPNAFTCGGTCASVCPGACCDPASCLCSAVTSTGCAAGTNFQGLTSTCSPSPCTGKCCNSTSGACTVVAPASCSAPNVFTCGGTCAVACTGVCCSTTSCACTTVPVAGCAAGAAFQGFASTCAPSPCTGKCCSTTTGVCSVTDPASCVSPSVFTCGGTCAAACPGVCCDPTSCACTTVTVTGCAAGTNYQGPATTCAASPCTGRCCSTLGACTLVAPANCVAPSAFTCGGSCSPNVCPQVACCTSLGACALSANGVCAAGAPQAAGSVCSPNPCPQVACCNLGACVLSVDGVCGAGSPLAGSTTCSPNPCPQIACCTSVGLCALSVDGVCGAGTPQAAGSVCSPNPCPQIACCTPVGACALSVNGTCGAGVPQGAGSVCSPNPCTQVACCNAATGGCATSINGVCALGTLGAPGSTCVPNLCPQIACCIIVAGAPVCNLSVNGVCNGSPQGAGSTCTPSPCTIDAACCTSVGACALSVAGGCPNGGVLQAAGSTCSPNPCTQTACCTPAGVCSLTTNGVCAGGSVGLPMSSTCTPNPCPQVACCTSLGACALSVNGVCGAGAPQAAGSVCAPNPCPQVACCNLGACALSVNGVCGAGSPLAGSTTCSPNPCPQIACCTSVGTCALSVNGVCGAGTPQAAGSVCSPNPCPQIACCTPVGACALSVNGTCGAGVPQGAGSVCSPNPCTQVACCTSVGACALSVNGVCGAGSPQAAGSVCSPNPCPQVACCSTAGACTLAVAGVCAGGSTPVAGAFACGANTCLVNPKTCCNAITGQCTVIQPAASCPTGTLLAPGTPTPSSCTPSPCPFPSAVGGATACADCTYLNGAFDGINGQISHLGGASPHGAKAADDFYLCENFMYDVKTFTATILTTTTLGLVKPKGEIWSDCGGCPGTLLYTFDNPLVVETGLNIGPAFDGRPLRIVHATFDVTRETYLPNKNVVLKGGRYWLSVYGQTDNQSPTTNDVTYWGTTAEPVKGKAAYKIDGNAGNAYNVFTFPNTCGPTGWHSVIDDCCIGCTDLSFSFCTTPCKVLIDNGGARVQVAGAANGSTSQFAPGSGSVFETRSADDFVVPGCQQYHICYVEACILTNCTTFEGVFELYANNCNKPSYALGGQPLFQQQYVAKKIIPLGVLYNSTIDGTAVYGYKLEFHDLNINLNGGAQYWISVGTRFSFSGSERAYFCYNSYCDNRCPIKYNAGRRLTFQTLDSEAAALGCVSAAPIVGCNGWQKLTSDFSFLIAADGLTTLGPINGTATCPTDFNRDGSLGVSDVFDYLNAWFIGCP